MLRFMKSAPIVATFAMMMTILPAVSFAADHNVNMKSLSYEPKTLAIKVGDSVQWTNTSLTEHSATSVGADISKFDTGLIEPKKVSKKISFQQPGNFTYQCSVHGKTMTGQITVSK